MMERFAEARVIRPAVDSRAGEAPAPRHAVELSLSLYAVELILAYEWILSGIDKLVNPHFSSQLLGVLRGSTLVNPYSWYSAFLKQFILPHAAILAPLVEVGEIAIGVVLASSAVLWLWRPLTRLALYAGWAACVTLTGSLLLALNYSFQQCTPLPWVNGAQAFSPGMGIDVLIALLSVPLLAANLRLVRSTAIELRSKRRHGTST